MAVVIRAATEAELVDLGVRHGQEADSVRAAVALMRRGFVQVAELDGRIVAAAGIAPMRHDHGEAWAWIDPLPVSAWKTIWPAMRHGLARALAERFYRVECFVQVDFPKGLLLARRLGCRVEGIKTAFGPPPLRADCVQFAAVRGR